MYLTYMAYITRNGAYDVRTPFIFLFRAFLVQAALFANALTAARAGEDQAFHTATYFEVTRPSVDKAIAVIKSEVDTSRKESGNQAALTLQEINRWNRFMVLESWSDQGAFDAHEKATHLAQFRAQMKALETAPPDERHLASFWHETMARSTPANAIFAVTHVDVMPDFAEDAAAMLKDLGEQAMKEKDTLLFIVTKQAGRPNHFTIEEGFANRAAYETHEAAAAPRAFRERLTPMLGALYDQRLYRAIE